MVQIGDYDFPEDRLYNKDHIWIIQDGDGDTVTMGIDAMGFSIAGDVSMIRVKKAGKTLKTGRAFGTMESGKGVVPLKSPVAGEILEVNPLIENKDFSTIMEDPLNNWLIKVKLSDPSELDGLMKSTGDISNWAKDELKNLK